MNKKNIYVLAGVLLIILLSLGVYLVVPRLLGNKKTEDTKSESAAEKEKGGAKSNQGEDNATPANPEEGQKTPSVTTNLPILEGASLTVYLSTEATFSQDGKTIIPAGSLQPYLFPQGSGVFSLQKKVGDNWVDVASNVSYAGHGGIAGAYAGPKEAQINYRAIKLERGNPILVSKTFTVNRAEITGGVKTYN